MERLAVLSLHSSPLAQPGAGDCGGMNVYVRELTSALAQSGVTCTVYTRAWRDGLAPAVAVEPGLEVVHVDAGPPALAKEALPGVIGEFTAAVNRQLTGPRPADAIHANYWLSGVAGHQLKHELDLPLLSTFHTLARVKSGTGDAEPGARAAAEAGVVGCSDGLLAAGPAEAAELELLYGADPARILLVPPGVDHAFFSPGFPAPGPTATTAGDSPPGRAARARRGARTALGLGEEPVLLFVGRIQPLKGLEVAVSALAELPETEATLLVVGGPSGPGGQAELDQVHAEIRARGLTHRVRFAPPQPHHLLATYYRAADVCLVPSRSESFGLVALEAAACGVPVVATAVGGLLTLVEDGRTGLLVGDRAPSAFAAAVHRILADPALARSMGAAAAKHALGYRWSEAAAKVRALAADLARRGLVDCDVAA